MATLDIPPTMRGLQIVQYNHPYILNPHIPTPIPGPGQLLIKIATAGYCHTETMVLRGEFAHMALRDSLPQVPSHEPAGWVAALGEGVDGAVWKRGMRVGCLNYRGVCGECKECKAGGYKYCTRANLAGITADGAFAEYMLADPLTTIPLPDNLSFEQAAPLFCAGATMYSALLRCQLSPGQSVSIIGCGALGHLGVQFAKVMGLKVVAVDARPAPLELVQTLKKGPDEVVDSTQETAHEAATRLPWEVDACVIATDALPAYEYAMHLTKMHGTVVIVGQPREPIPLSYPMVVFKDLTIRGSALASPEECKGMVKMFAENELEVRTKVYGLEEVGRLIEDTHKEGMSGKMVVRIAETF